MVIAETVGVFARIFVDFGAAFVVNDRDGEDPSECYIKNIDYATNEFSSYHRTQAPRKFNNEPVVRQLGNSEESLDEELDFSEENADEEFDAPVLLSILNGFIQSKKGN